MIKTRANLLPPEVKAAQQICGWRKFSLEQAQEITELQKGWVNGKTFAWWYWVKAVENHQLALLKSVAVSPVQPYQALSRKLRSADMTGGRIFPPSARTIPRQPVIFLNNEVRARRKLGFDQLVKINARPDLLYCTQWWGVVHTYFTCPCCCTSSDCTRDCCQRSCRWEVHGKDNDP